MVVSFFICWVPFHAQRLLASYLAKDENQNQLLLDIYLKLTYISGVMYYLSSTINPLLYQLMSAKFRLAFKETFKCSLFKCATFLRSGTAGNSPTNSVKERPQQGNHYHHHKAGTSGAGGSYFCSQSSSHQGEEPAARGQLTHLDSKLSGTSVLDLQTGCCCCCCSAGDPMGVQRVRATRSAIWEPYGATQAQAGVMARLKGRLNSSLSSLFRTNSQSAEQSTTCPCCALNQGVTSQAEPRALVALGKASAAQARIEELGATVKHSTSCASTPLLLHHQHSDGLLLREPAPLSRTATGGSVSPSNFSAHSMLKFIRSPTPLHCGHLNRTSLTRLSSREEPDEQPAEQHQVVEASASADERMDLLIRPTLDQENQEPALRLKSVNSTSGESGNSTAGSSPDQQQLLNRSANLSERRRTPVCMSRSGATSQNRKHRQKLSSWSSNGSNTILQAEAEVEPGKPEAQRRRRRASFQPSSLNVYHGELNGSAANRRRESSSSSTNRHLSSSLSSSERQLDKKSSISTTTSAIDCGSYTTTNSQLTANGVNGCGSNPSQADWTV